MRESPPALQAFNDYEAMGAERSLEKLAVAYQNSTEPTPTRHLRTLKQWSTNFMWQARLAGLLAKEREEREARIREERRKVFDEGLALDFQRVRLLQSLATKQARLASKLLDRLEVDEHDNPYLTRRYDSVMTSLANSLKDLAAETGGRVKHIELDDRRLVDGLAEYARQLGLGEQEVQTVTAMFVAEKRGR